MVVDCRFSMLVVSIRPCTWCGNDLDRPSRLYIYIYISSRYLDTHAALLATRPSALLSVNGGMLCLMCAVL